MLENLLVNMLAKYADLCKYATELSQVCPKHATSEIMVTDIQYSFFYCPKYARKSNILVNMLAKHAGLYADICYRVESSMSHTLLESEVTVTDIQVSRNI